MAFMIWSMSIKEVYEAALLEDLFWLQTLIEFLLHEKEVITLDDDESVLNLYFKENNQKRMNNLLLEYQSNRRKGTG